MVFYRSKDWRRKLQRKTTQKTQIKHKIHICISTQNSVQIKDTRINTACPLVYNNMGWLGDGSHRGQGCQAWTAVGLPPWYPYSNIEKTRHNDIALSIHRVSKKNKQNYFCYNYVKLPPNLIIFGIMMANCPKLYEIEMHSFSTSPNSRPCTTVLNADVPNCYITL